MASTSASDARTPMISSRRRTASGPCTSWTLCQAAVGGNSRAGSRNSRSAPDGRGDRGRVLAINASGLSRLVSTSSSRAALVGTGIRMGMSCSCRILPPSGMIAVRALLLGGPDDASQARAKLRALVPARGGEPPPPPRSRAVRCVLAGSRGPSWCAGCSPPTCFVPARRGRRRRGFFRGACGAQAPIQYTPATFAPARDPPAAADRVHLRVDLGPPAMEQARRDQAADTQVVGRLARVVASVRNSDTMHRK
jgi:hypothetical protein